MPSGQVFDKNATVRLHIQMSINLHTYLFGISMILTIFVIILIITTNKSQSFEPKTPNLETCLTKIIQTNEKKGLRMNGDTIIDSRSHQKCHWGTTVWMESVLNLPTTGNYTKHINYVQVLVKSNSGRVDVDVLSGGIGESMIKLKIVAYNTQLFNYDVVVYGI